MYLLLLYVINIIACQFALFLIMRLSDIVSFSRSAYIPVCERCNVVRNEWIIWSTCWIDCLPVLLCFCIIMLDCTVVNKSRCLLHCLTNSSKCFLPCIGKGAGHLYENNMLRDSVASEEMKWRHSVMLHIRVIAQIYGSKKRYAIYCEAEIKAGDKCMKWAEIVWTLVMLLKLFMV